ncbi:MAG: tetratricopeptide repeat protein [Candidatus Manganitrophaceae bacterium]|nr:MAG: tetratricopeptide repeat protein [Candidatus Manganitrophaceae bacterium]
MKNVIVLSIALVFLAGCGTTSHMFGSSSEPRAAVPKQLPESVKDEFNKGVAAFEKEQYVNAQEHFQNVTRIDPNIPEAHLNLALSLYRQGKTDQADKEFQTAQRLLSKEFGMGGAGRGAAPRSDQQGMSGTPQ